MTKNPILNALAASGYITLLVTLMNLLSQKLKNTPDTFFTPVVMLSLLTLSVAMMAYLFFYQPIQLFVGGKKKEATDLFIKTVGIFAAITAVFLGLVTARIL